MGNTVFVKVVGFEDAERHALNTLFHLSRERATRYRLWAPACGGTAELALIDSDSYEAQLEFASPSNAGLPMVWVGPGAPRRAWRSFERPLQWPEVIAAMDTLFQPPPAVDVPLEPPRPELPSKRALIANADPAQRLYLRARLALAGITRADEAGTGAQALELARSHAYDVALVEFALPGVSGWELVRRIARSRPRIPLVIVTKVRVSAMERLRAWWRGHGTLLPQPPHPGRLSRLLEQV